MRDPDRLRDEIANGDRDPPPGWPRRPRLQATSHRVVESSCPNCGNKADAATAVGNVDLTPRPGDYTVCVCCGHVLVYADDLKVREPTEKEIDRIAGHPILLEAQRIAAVWRKLKAARNDPG